MPLTVRSSTGKGTTVALSTSTGAIALVHKIQPGVMKREVVETTHLATASNARTYFGVELYDGGEYEVEMELDTTKTPATYIISANQTFTLTRALLASGSGTQPTVAFDAIWTEWAEGEISNMQLLMVKAKFKVSGPITFTAPV